MTYLVDSSVWLERLLEQEQAEEVGNFLDRVPDHQLAITDFAFHSICLIALRAGARETLAAFVRDTFVEGKVARLSLAAEETTKVLDAMQRFGLDYDDGYQYVAAARYGVALVALDGDFDATDRGRLTPRQAVQQRSPE